MQPPTGESCAEPPDASWRDALVSPLARRADADLVTRSCPGYLLYPGVSFLILLMTEPADPVRPLLAVLAVAALLVAGARFALAFGREAFQARWPAVWRPLFLSGVAASAAVWSAFVVVLVQAHGLDAIGSTTVFATIGFAAGGSVSLTPFRAAQWIYLLLMIAPVKLVLVALRSPAAYGVVFMFALFLPYMLAQARQGHRQYWGALCNTRLLERRAAELDEARRAAERASRAKGEFLANMSHEIRTPMNGILGMTELVLESELTPDQRENLGVVLSSGRSLLSLINEILDLSKIEADRLELESLPFGLRDVIRQSVAPFRAVAGAERVPLHVRVDEDVPDALVGDAERLRQVLVNLVGNARKFTHEGQIELVVSRGIGSGQEARVRFRVTDTGIGIPRAQQRAIFERFSQGDGSATRSYGGTGLGLTICQHLVRLMGGRLWLESEVGRGSSFEFEVPFLLTDPRACAGARDGSAGDAPIPDEARWRVLVAEDNPVNARLMHQLLCRHGHEVVLVRNGAEAVAALTGSRFDVVLMDVQMPTMDGLAATRLIRQGDDERGDHTAIVALTAHAMRGDRERCLAAGMDEYVSKPVRRHELFAAMAAAVEAAETRRRVHAALV
jgi:signal transduction histidine kinase/CheY-like chemotaxis protein